MSRHSHSTSAGGDPGDWMGMNFNPSFSSQFLHAMGMLPDGAKNIIVLVKSFLEYVLAMYSLPLEVYLRWRRGTRALSLFQVCFLVSLPFSSLFWTGNRLLALFLLGSAAAGVWQFVEARRWEKRPRAPYRLSFSWGEPIVWAWLAGHIVRARLVPKRLFTEATVFRFFEPATGLLGLPLIYLPPTRPLGILLLIAGSALFLKRHLLHQREVEVTRDRRDAVAIGKILSAAAEAEREDCATGEIFVVKLAPRVITWSEPPPFMPLIAKMVASPDAAGRPKVECPACASRIRCPSDYAGRSLNCPKCETPFLVGAE